MTETYPAPRKVLMTADTTGGVWTYAVDLAYGLTERGVEVALATMGDPLTDSQREKVERIPRLKVFESTFKTERMDDPWRDVEKAGEWLLALEERIGPDVIHLNGYAHGALPWSAPKVMVGHSCLRSWARAVQGEDATDCERYTAEVAAGLEAADLVVAPSEAMLACLAENYGRPRRSRVIYNGRDAKTFKPGAKEPIVFAAGRMDDAAKNLAALELVAPSLSWPIFVAGENLHPEAGEARTHHTRSLGRLSPRALAAWLGRASIFCMPCRYEPFGYSILEAALSGCVLVLGDIPSLREIWRHRAVLVPPGDTDAIAAAVQSLIDDPDRRSALAAGARARALQLTPAKMVDAYLAAYGEVLAEEASSLSGADAGYPVAV